VIIPFMMRCSDWLVGDPASTPFATMMFGLNKLGRIG